MKNYIKKENILIFIITLIITSLINYYFFSPHMIQDSYKMSTLTYMVYRKQTFFPVGRLLSAELLSFFNYANIGIPQATVITHIISVIISSITTMILYINNLSFFKQNKKNKLLIYLIVLLTTNNIFIIQINIFVESCIIWLSILLAIIAAIIFTSNIKNTYKFIVTLLLCTLCIFSYQPSLPIFITYSTVLMMLKKIDNKKFIINLIIAIIIYGISAFLNMQFIYLYVQKILYVAIYKLHNTFTIKQILLNFIYYFKAFFIDSISYELLWFRKYVLTIILLIISALVIYLNNKNNIKSANKKYIISFIAITIFTILPTLAMKEVYFSSRMYFGLLMFYPMIFIYILTLIKNKKTLKIILIATILIGVINIQKCMAENNYLKKLNSDEKRDALYIIDRIDKYEKETNVKVNEIIYYCDTNPTYSNDYCNSKKIRLFNNAIYQEKFINDVLLYYGGKKINSIKIGDEKDITYKYFFKKKDFNEFGKDNVIIRYDKLYICYY